MDDKISATQTFALSKSSTYLLYLICILLAGLLYVNTLNHDYAVDDTSQIVQNKIVQKGPSAIGEIMTTAYREGYSQGNETLYRPLSLVVFAIQWGISPDNPMLGHAVNILFYMLLAWLVFNTYRLITTDLNPLVPFLATLVFIAHPMHTEVVANIKSLDEILSLIFSLLTLNFFLRWGNGNKAFWLLPAFITATAAAFSKEIAVTLIVLVPLTLGYFSKANARRIFLATGLTAAAIVIYLLMRVSVLGAISTFHDISVINNSLVQAGDDMSVRLATAIMLLGKYMLMMFVPWPLSRDYAYATIQNVPFSDPAAMLALAAIIFLTYYVIRNFNKRSPLVYGILFFGISISLVSNVFFLIEAPFGERFTFMPSFGFSLAFIAWLSRFERKKKQDTSNGFFAQLKSKPALSVIALGMTCVFSFLTIARNPAWKDDYTLYITDLPTCPESARLHFGYGRSILLLKVLETNDLQEKENLINEGISELETAVGIAPGYIQAWKLLGDMYAREKKNYPKALECYHIAWDSLYINDPDFLNSRGIVFGELKKYDSAFIDFQRAIELQPKNSSFVNNLANYQLFANRPAEAEQTLKKAFGIDPGNPKSLYLTGNLFAASGKYQEAIVWYDSAISADQDYAAAWMHAGNCFGILGNYQKAVEYLLKAKEFDPGNKQNLFNLGNTYKMLGQPKKAEEYLSQIK